MHNDSVKYRINAGIILFFVTVLIAMCSSGAFAASAPAASAQVNSSDGAILRKSSSTGSAQLAVLSDDTPLTIHKEVFKKKKSTAKKNKWYYVTANGKKGYIRADLVDNISYGYAEGKIKAKVNFRKGAGTKMKKAGTLKKGTKVTVVLLANPVNSARGSSKKWYRISTSSGSYYVCSTKVKLTGKTVTASASASGAYVSYVDTPVANMTEAQFEAYLTAQGFPEDYKVKLRALHSLHPNWGYTACHTGIKWSDALAAQTKGGRSLINKAYPASYRSGSKQYESGWYKANSKVVAYFMDPRNFLDENSIYMFEDLSYKPSYQTAAAAAAILSPTKLPGYGFTADLFVSAGAANNVSPVFLASRARQETGNGGDAVNGTKILGTPVYNPFNIGAFGGTNPLYNGLLYAYAKKWTSPALAISGGAQELAKNYINQGQYTGYYQRFNVRNGADKAGTHQYMTNITAPYTEALATRNSYAKYGITGQGLVFEIPVYISMPAATALP